MDNEKERPSDDAPGSVTPPPVEPNVPKRPSRVDEQTDEDDGEVDEYEDEEEREEDEGPGGPLAQGTPEPEQLSRACSRTP